MQKNYNWIIKIDLESKLNRIYSAHIRCWMCSTLENDWMIGD